MKEYLGTELMIFHFSVVNGRLRCLGSAQHLKHRFGNGFEVNIRTKSDMLKNFYLGLDRSQAPESEEYSIAGLAARVLSNPTMNSLVHRQKSLSFQGTSSAIAGKNICKIFYKSFTVCIVGNLSDKLSDIQNIRVEIDDLQSLCNTLGSAERIKEINQKGSGSIIQEIIVAEGYVSLPVFLDWWISETVAIQLHVYMNKEFHNRAKLLERSTAHNFRYRILNEEDADSEKIQGALSLVFSKFEADKEQLRVSEYSVGQTTLEQIFNQFAAQQDNPELSTSN